MRDLEFSFQIFLENDGYTVFGEFAAFSISIKQNWWCPISSSFLKPAGGCENNCNFALCRNEKSLIVFWFYVFIYN